MKQQMPMMEKQIRQSVAFELLELLMQERLAKGYNTLLIEDVNHVLLVAQGRVLMPKPNEEVQIVSFMKGA